ncbi:MAG: hypothetical protein JNL38_10405 [Myxococcales bacterium]|nr:hypothetical protein [Myxococcales bacterium]
MSVLAVVSKAVFEKEARSGRAVLGIGATWATARYASENPALASLHSGGDLWLVTVRPGDVLWLVGVLRSPKAKSGGWSATPNEAPIRDITALIPKLRFASGKGVTAAPGKLGMSLQTPRVLADGDVALLEAAVKGARGKGGAPPATAAEAYAGAVAATPAMKKARAHAKEAAAAEGQPGLRLAARRAPYEALTREDKKLLAEIADEIADEEARPGVEVLDVVDAATGDRRYLFALWPYGSGAVVDVATKAIVADVCQHYLELQSKDRTLPERLAAAWHRDRDALGVREMVSFEQGAGNPKKDTFATSAPAREEAPAFAGALALPAQIDGQSFPAGRLVSDAVHEVRPVEGVLEALLQVGAGKRIVLFAELARLPPRGDLTGAQAKPPKGAQAGSPTCYGAHAERWVRFLGELGARMGGHAIATSRMILDERADWAATWGPKLTANPSLGAPFWLEQCVALAVLARSAKRAGGALDPVHDARLRVLADCFDASYALPPILEELPPERAGAIACGQIELVAKFPSAAGAAAAIARFEQWGGGPYYEKKLRAALTATGPAAGPALEAAIAKGGPQAAALKKLLPKGKAKSR